MKKPIKVLIQFDIKLIKKCFALLEIDIPSDEEINARFFERDTILAENVFAGMEDAELAICMALIGIVIEQEEKEES